MPPVRWKLLLAVAATCLLLRIEYAKGERIKNTVSMTSDGWRPIIGNHHQESYHKAITQYRNPSQLNEPVKVEPQIPTPPSTSPPISSEPSAPKPTQAQVPINNINNQAVKHQSNKVPAHSKHPQPNHFFVLPTHTAHGPHIPLVPLRPTQKSPYTKHPTKFHGHVIGGKRHIKPIRLQAVAHSTRDEVFVPAPSGTFAYYNQNGQNNVKVREATGLSNNGFKPFRISPLHTHVDFTNNFAFSGGNENIFQPLPLYNFVTPKPQQNEVQYTFLTDDFTRNLVPPPFKKLKEDKPITKTTTETLLLNLNKPVKVEQPENVVLQLPPPFEQKPFGVQQNKDLYDVQVSKEKLKVYYDSVPPSFNPQFATYQTINRPQTPPPKPPPKPLTYEVTESKQWPEPPIFQTKIPEMKFLPKQKPSRNRLPQVQISPPQPSFLPTPYNGDTLAPTLPTQGEISTIFTELSKRQKLKEHASTNGYFDTKEVSTHYPILGKPEQPQTQFPVQPIQEYLDSFNEITTKQYYQQIEQNETTEQPKTTTSTTSRPTWQRRPNHRRRRPINRTRTSTTEEPNVNTEMVDIEKEAVTEPQKIYRQRRPIKMRTTTEVEPTTYRHRYRNRIKPLTEHYSNSQEDMDREQKTTPEAITVRPNRIYTTESVNDEEEMPYIGDFHKTASLEEDSEEEPIKQFINEYQPPVRFFERPSTTTEDNKMDDNEETTTVVEILTRPRLRTRGRISTTLATTEQLPTTHLHIPNEIEDIVTTSERSETIQGANDDEDEERDETTTTTTTTTTEATTTKSHRIRGRPIKYGSNRPRFSVKDYRQRLNQYTSTTSTTEANKPTPDLSRYRNRIRRPSLVQDDEDTTETSRPKFKPKEPRHGTVETSEATITEKPVKTNTRLRPFGRYRSTTESATTQKISIKPNILTNLRRPPPISLRNRIYNRNRNNTKTTEAPAMENEPANASVETTMSEQNVTTEFGVKKAPDEAILYSQRVSDLTSSAKNDFKTIPPTSRRVPNHFTISTDDPILPIEAFFPNIKDKKH